MAELPLPVHESADLAPYINKNKKLFWKAKTKGPYPWGDDAAGGEYPWLSFLGFQFKRDLTARLRPEAIGKRQRIISALATEAIQNYQRSVRHMRAPIAQERLIRSFRYRVLASSFGRHWEDETVDARNELSWHAWAGQLHRWPHDRSFLKRLDKHFRRAEAWIRKEIGANRGGRRMTKASEYQSASFFHLFAKLGLPSREDVHPDYKK